MTIRQASGLALAAAVPASLAVRTMAAAQVLTCVALDAGADVLQDDGLGKP